MAEKLGKMPAIVVEPTLPEVEGDSSMMIPLRWRCPCHCEYLYLHHPWQLYYASYLQREVVPAVVDVLKPLNWVVCPTVVVMVGMLMVMVAVVQLDIVAAFVAWLAVELALSVAALKQKLDGL